MTWNVGNVRITRVVEFVMPFPVDFFAEATPEDVADETWLGPDFVDADGVYLMSLHTFVVESDGLRILVDTCTGNAKIRPLIPEFGHQHRPFLEKLTAAGFAPTRSTSSSARTCTSTMRDGTRIWSTANGSRRSLARATCSALPISTAGRTPKPGTAPRSPTARALQQLHCASA
jgi:hypothetical protein